ncbi:MAG: DUF305 domain-containing protein [Actinomycetales bacterium]
MAEHELAAHTEATEATDATGGDAAYAGGGLLGSRALQIGALVLAGVLALVIAAIVGRTTAGSSSPGDSSAAAGFARDMTDHHAQAVNMATIIGQRTQESDLRALATDIALTQTNQMGQMQGWLNQWGLTLGRTGPPMAWMTRSGMDMHYASGRSAPAVDPALMRPLADGRMPGMATAAQVNELRTLPEDKAEVLFLQLMIAHHRAGIAMAQMAETLTREPVVDRLAAAMIAGQEAEIAQMTEMLSARGATP